MSKFIFLNVILIINYLLTSQKKCGRYEVAHCSVCDYDLEICTKCEDNYFVLYGGTECVKCDDKDFGQPQCDGKCDDSRYDEIGKVLCDNCKEGFYSIEESVLAVKVVQKNVSNALIKLLQEVIKKYIHVLIVLVDYMENIEYLKMMENVVFAINLLVLNAIIKTER